MLLAETMPCIMPGCSKRVTRNEFMCPEHWALVPTDNRKPLMKARKHDRQLSLRRPSKMLTEAAQLAIREALKAMKHEDNCACDVHAFLVSEAAKAAGF